MPGPGQYEVKSQFERKPSDEGDQDADHPTSKVPFGSRLEVCRRHMYYIMSMCLTWNFVIITFVEVPHSRTYISSMHYLWRPSHCSGDHKENRTWESTFWTNVSTFQRRQTSKDATRYVYHHHFYEIPCYFNVHYLLQKEFWNLLLHSMSINMLYLIRTWNLQWQSSYKFVHWTQQKSHVRWISTVYASL